MKTIKIDDIHYSMLKDIGKKWRMSPEDLIAELIQETYSSKKKEKVRIFFWVPMTSRGNQIQEQ